MNNLYYIECLVKKSEKTEANRKRVYIINQEINIDYFIKKIKDKYINNYDNWRFQSDFITILSIELIAGKETDIDFLL